MSDEEALVGVGVFAMSSARLCTDAASASSGSPRGARGPGERDSDLFWPGIFYVTSLPLTIDDVGGTATVLKVIRARI